MRRVKAGTGILRSLFAGLALGAAATQAQAAESIWNHNGSEMLWRSQGDNRAIYYQTPRAGLPVAPGTLLFDGQRVGDVLQGTARIFRQGCPPAEYWVSGPILDETHVILRGAAPVRASSGCTVTGYSETSSNATLEFTYLRSTGTSVPGQDLTGGGVTTQPADEEYGQDAVGYQIFSIPLPDASEILVRVDTGVGSHAMPDVVAATLTCASGARYDLMPPGAPFYTCRVQDVSADTVSRTLVIDSQQYDHDTGACAAQRFEYSYAGLCR